MALEFQDKSIYIKNLEDSELNARKLNVNENIHELAMNIRKNGLIHPLTVREEGSKFKVIIGQRRLKACKMLGMDKVPCRVVKTISSEQSKILSLSENIFRLRMESEDISNLCNELYIKHKNIQIVAKKIGVTAPTAKKYIGYYSVPEEIKKLVNEKKIGPSKALEIYTMFESKAEQIKIAKHLSRILDLKERRAFKRSITKSQPYDKLANVISMASKIKNAKEIKIFLNPKPLKKVTKIKIIRDTDEAEIVEEIMDDWADSIRSDELVNFEKNQ